MQVICPISGLPWQTAPYMLGFDFAKIHPIFAVKRSKLLTDTLVHKFRRAEHRDEKALCFLALANSTGLVTFHVPAKPTPATCEKNFFELLTLAQWMDYAFHKVGKDLSFPRYSVRSENADLENVNVWIAALMQIRKEFTDKDTDRDRAHDLAVKYDNLQKEFSSVHLKNVAFTPKIVNWALEECSLDEDHHPRGAYFYKMLTTSLEDAWGLDRDDLLELKEEIIDALPLSHPMAAPLFGQLNALIAAQKEGFTNFQIKYIDSADSQIDEVSKSRQIVNVDKYRNDFVLKHGNLNEPVRASYASTNKGNVDFLVAHARWELATKKIATNAPNVIPSLEEQVKEELDNHVDTNAETYSGVYKNAEWTNESDVASDDDDLGTDEEGDEDDSIV